MPEKQNIERKSKWKDAYLEWVCGFANAQGGKMDIGRNDGGERLSERQYKTETDWSCMGIVSSSQTRGVMGQHAIPVFSDEGCR